MQQEAASAAQPQGAATQTDGHPASQQDAATVASTDLTSVSSGGTEAGSGAAAAVAAVPAVAGIEAAAALAAAAGAEVDEDGILITEQHKREARLAYFGANVSRMSACLTMGGALMAVDRAALARAKASLVVNAAADVVPSAFRHEGVPYIALYVTDSASTELSAVFPALCSALLSAERAGRTVFVHCHQGVSRSGAIVCAYLMYRWGLDADAAILAARKCRGTVSPNAGFRVQLHQWGQWLRQWRGHSEATEAWTALPSSDAAPGAAVAAPEGVTVPSRCLDITAPLPANTLQGALPCMFAAVPLPANVQVYTAGSDAVSAGGLHPLSSLCLASRSLGGAASAAVHPADDTHKTRDESLEAITASTAARVNFATQHVRCVVVAVRQGPLRSLAAPTKACLVPDAVMLVQTSSHEAYTHEAIPRVAIWVGSSVPASFRDTAVAAAQAEAATWAHLIPEMAQEGRVPEGGVPVLVQGTSEADAYAQHMPSAAPVSSAGAEGGAGGLSASHRAALEESLQAHGASTARGAGSSTSRGAAPPPMADPAPVPPAAVLSVLRSVSEAAALKAGGADGGAATATVEGGAAAAEKGAAQAPARSIADLAAGGGSSDAPLAPRGGAHEVNEDEAEGNPSMSLGRPSLYRLASGAALGGGALQRGDWERLGEYDHEDLEDGGVFALVAVGATPPEEVDSDDEEAVDPFDLTLEQAAAAPHCVWLWLGPDVAAGADVAAANVASSVLEAHYGSRGVPSPPAAALQGAVLKTQRHEAEEEEFWDWFVAGF